MTIPEFFSWGWQGKGGGQRVRVVKSSLVVVIKLSNLRGDLPNLPSLEAVLVIQYQSEENEIHHTHNTV